MDAIMLATITSALTLISTEVAKGAASEAGKALWAQIKAMFGWAEEPKPADLAPQIAVQLGKDPELAKKLVKLLQSQSESNPQASALVQRIDADKSIVAGVFNVAGNFKM